MIGLNDNGEWTELTKEEIAARQAKAQKYVNKCVEDCGVIINPKKSVEQMLAEINAKLGK